MALVSCARENSAAEFEAPRRNFPPRGRTEKSRSVPLQQEREKSILEFFTTLFFNSRRTNAARDLPDEVNSAQKDIIRQKHKKIFKNEDRCAFCEHREW